MGGMDTSIPIANIRKLPAAGDTVHRAFQVQRAAIDEAKRTVELAFSSEEPYERWWGVEILDHSKGACDLSRLKAGGPLLCDHDARDHVGVIESVRIDSDRVGRAVVRFGKSARAEEIFRDVVDGIRQNVSVGYQIEDIVLAEKKDDKETYRVKRWTPFEISLVSVPADFTVGVGRHASTETTPPKEIKAMTAAAVDTPAPAAPVVDVVKVQKEARDAALKNQREIRAIGEQFKSYGIENEVAAALDAGIPVEQFRASIMQVLASKPLPAPAAQVGLSANETQRYSVLRLIRALVDRQDPEAQKAAGMELEVHRAIMKRAQIGTAPNAGFFVPLEVQKRDLTAGTPNAGGYLVANDNLAGSFIDLLRNRSLVAQFGATMLPDLVGNVTIPKQTGSATLYWLTNEAQQITESQIALGQLAMTPKTAGAYTEISRQLMLQSSPAADNLVMADFARIMGIGIDLAALDGTGNSGQPLGVIRTSGVGSVAGAALDYADIVEFQTDVAGSNALIATSGYMTTPAVAGLLKGRQRFTNTDTPIWQGNILDGQIEGFKAAATNQMPSATMVFGDWSQIVIGMWGLMEIAMNPYANFQAGISGIRVFQTVDVGVRIPGAFSVASSIS